MIPILPLLLLLNTLYSFCETWMLKISEEDKNNDIPKTPKEIPMTTTLKY